MQQTQQNTLEYNDNIFGDQVSERSNDTNIEKYAINLIDKVRNGKIDPIIGRDDELKRMEQILLCRRKNNPLAECKVVWKKRYSLIYQPKESMRLRKVLCIARISLQFLRKLASGAQKISLFSGLACRFAFRLTCWQVVLSLTV